MQFLKDMILLNPKDFGSADIPIGIILLGLAVGMILATVAIQITNMAVYRMLKALLRHKCTDEGSAKTLKELKLSGDKQVVCAIKRENPILMRYLCVASEKAAQKNADIAGAEAAMSAPKTDEAFASVKKDESTTEAQAKYYVRETCIDRAKEILSRGEVGVLQTVGLCGLLLLLYFGFAALLTWILPMLF